MGYLYCCWQPNAYARLFSVLLPTHLHYLVNYRLFRAQLPTHLKYGLFALLLAIQSTVAEPFTLQSEFRAKQAIVAKLFRVPGEYFGECKSDFCLHKFFQSAGKVLQFGLMMIGH